ncbi:cell wall / vacuolar inhibitor of fructosidase 1-like [Cicer arietinum]|uniref:Cell wall / vacuolar inhibitor of fructosidase 1-like n=1 Tax=Cicer arietinum TaxID=3827 RepID=A0A1S2YQA9_CICAR|nr:cell wall / vacuolar inhibitor of fructosidase 1-like [Cicer arietinum]
MRMLKSLAVILCSFLVVTECNANLVEETCKKTQNYNLCIKCLNSDPRSSTSDLNGLALIMVNTIKLKAQTTLIKIRQVIETIGDKLTPPQKQTLNSCTTNYNTILNVDVHDAYIALQQGNPRAAKDGVNDAATKGSTCENDFSRKFPDGIGILGDTIKIMNDVATVASNIIGFLTP